MKNTLFKAILISLTFAASYSYAHEISKDLEPFESRGGVSCHQNDTSCLFDADIEGHAIANAKRQCESGKASRISDWNYVGAPSFVPDRVDHMISALFVCSFD